MATTNSLIVTDLDFDNIKNNLINFLQSQQEFSDYNFQGSGLQVLLNLLAYNTHYNGFYTNMLSNELTITTAQVKDNINRHAKSLNYVPQSMVSPTAYINITVTPDTPTNNPSNLVIPRYTPFISQSVNGSNFNFVTTEAYTASYNGNSYNFNNIPIKEGVVVNLAYPASAATGNTFNIPNANIDTTTLLVSVNETGNVQPQTIVYTLNSDITQLDGNSRVYFLEGSDNSTYNIYFGDGILGRSLLGGDTVYLSFLNTNGDLANYANNFTIVNPITNYSNVIVQSVTSSAGGAQAEDIDSIKYNAPLAYTTQNRAVTLEDYTFLLQRDYKNIGSVSVWSGKDNNPPIYGKVFISIKPLIGNYLTNTQKQQVTSILSQYNMTTTIPTLVDPNYTYILINSEVNYNPKLLNVSQAQLENNITTSVLNYASTQLGKFSSTYRDSTIDNVILQTDQSILGVSSSIYLQKRFVPVLGSSLNYTLNYYSPLKRGGYNEKIYSSPAFTMYDYNGNLQTCYIEEDVQTYNGITEIAINNPGFDYDENVIVEITGDGSGAKAHAVVINGSINSIVLDDPGVNYNFATVNIIGTGYNATATPILQAAIGILKTYFISNSNKFIINNNQGTVDHINGIITINNFNPVQILGQTNQISINAVPETSIILPQTNNILLIDPNDPSAIQINLLPQVI